MTSQRVPEHGGVASSHTADVYTEVSPQELLGSGFAAPRINDDPWLVRWDLLGPGTDVDAFVLDRLAETVDLETSGSTGPSRCWRRTREQMWAEAGLLAALVERDRPQALLSFAPPKHVYGALASVLVPARLRLPAWYRPRYFGAMPAPQDRRWAIVAVPWTFSILRRHSSWVGGTEHLSVLHSTATLPLAAESLVEETGRERIRVVEVFGSTEAGGIASRTWGPDRPPWELFEDVEFAPRAETPAETHAETPAEIPAGSDGASAGAPGDVTTGAPDGDIDGDIDGAPGEETPLVVRSPRLAFRPGEAPADVWRTDDYVRRLDARRFRFDGRRDRLVKINGRRVDLDRLEESVRSVLRCADLAFLPVTDAFSGENFDLLVVPEGEGALSVTEVRAAVGRFDARPRQVRLVDRIDRSDTGKLRRLQRPSLSDAGADT
ncbi:long-chain fatty acid--CoA ligase [Streptosporangium sp. NPDC050855]|uniref:long-chain fatty acid--CoA ligase n=1 Tax=Streptosporangium sp. NPDC050855 TaxID=3366194 RepID=UPI00379B427C